MHEQTPVFVSERKDYRGVIAAFDTDVCHEPKTGTLLYLYLQNHQEYPNELTTGLARTMAAQRSRILESSFSVLFQTKLALARPDCLRAPCDSR